MLNVCKEVSPNFRKSVRAIALPLIRPEQLIRTPFIASYFAISLNNHLQIDLNRLFCCNNEQIWVAIKEALTIILSSLNGTMKAFEPEVKRSNSLIWVLYGRFEAKEQERSRRLNDLEPSQGKE